MEQWCTGSSARWTCWSCGGRSWQTWIGNTPVSVNTGRSEAGTDPGHKTTSGRTGRRRSAAHNLICVLAALLRSRCAHGAAFQTPDLGVQIRQRLLHQIPVSGILARFQFPQDPGARKIQSFPPSEQFQLFRWNLLIQRRTDLSLGRLDLRLDRFTFPTSCHAPIIRWGIAPGVALFWPNP